MPLVEVLDELGDPAAVVKLRADFSGSTRSSVSVMVRPLFRNASSRRRCRQGVEIEHSRVHDGGVRLEGDLGAGLIRLCRSSASGALGMPRS